MKAGTATKLVLNTITTGAMIRLGKTFGNLMVDLRATNDKLRDRAERIVMELLGLTTVDARALLARAGGSVKVAYVMQSLGVDAADAAHRLDAADGALRRVVPAAPPGVRA
jgi:N-acetylmuramic acid 6-phosphate etherase